MFYESSCAAMCCAVAETSGWLARRMCQTLIYAAVCSACAAASGWLAIMMCHALIYAAL